MRKRTILWIALVAIAIFIVGRVAVDLANPLKQSEDRIRASLLLDTPLGSPLEEVHKFIRSKGWQEEGIGLDRSFKDATKEPGSTAKFVVLGHYTGFMWSELVYAGWIFNADDVLVEVLVGKTRRSP